MSWTGNDTLRPLLVPIDELTPHPRNPRLHDLPAIAKSLERFGQQRPVLCLPDGTIVAGHGTVQAAREYLGWNDIAVVRSDLPDEEVEAYVLADNRTGDLGGYDAERLGAILDDLAERGALEGTGYTVEDRDTLLAELDERRRIDEELARARGDGGDQPRLDQREPGYGDNLREIVLTFVDKDAHDRFVSYVRMLKKEYETEGVVETINEAIRRAAEAL